MTRVACIGECMIELSQAGGGLIARGWGGDTLNTAVYLARLGVAVDYVTALGDWLALPNVAAVGGSWLAPAADMRAGNWPAITDRARRAVARLPKRA